MQKQTKDKMKVLILTYSFYPYNTVAALRWTRFVNYLPSLGIKPYIITTKHKNKEIKEEEQSKFPNTIRKMSPFSYSFESPVNPLKYDKKENIFSYAVNYLMRLIKDIVLSPDKDIIWSLSIIPTAYQVIKKEKIEALIVTGDPFSLFVAGRILKKLTNIKLILDYRDPWLSNTANKAQTFYRQRYIKQLQKKSLADADYVFTVNKEIYDELEMPLTKKEILTNGFDPELFEDEANENVSIPHFTFFYAGKLEINSFRYNPIFMLKCFQAFRESGEEYKEARFIICGHIGKETLQKIEEEGLNENIEFKGEVENIEVIRIGKTVDALVHSVYPHQREVSLPMKIYEYVMLKKPILSINSEKGLVAELLDTTNAGSSCYNDDLEAAVRIMQRFFHQDKERFKAALNLEPVKAYNIRFLTERLAMKLKSI